MTVREDIKRKSIVATVLAALLCLTAGAQVSTQKGMVKTKGRMVSGKLVAGKGVPSAAITLKGGNAVVSNTGGDFMLRLSGNKYFLQNVQKQGYVLTDPDVLSREYTFSANPLVITIELAGLQAEDRLDAERKIRRTLQKKLQEKEEELEALKAKNELSQTAYQKQLAQLYADQQENERLINEMVTRYSQIDYDLLEQSDQMIHDLILQGELRKADSLINARGNLQTEIALQQKKRDALDESRKKLEAATAAFLQERDGIAARCLNKFDIFRMQHMNDSAATYIDLRANLDTTQIEWQFDAAVFHARQNNFKKAETYYLRALTFAKEESKKDKSRQRYVAETLNNLGILYSAMGKDKASTSAYEEALAICQDLQDDESIEPLTAKIMNNLGILSEKARDLEKAEKWYKKALAIRERWADVNIQLFKPQYAQTLNNLAALYLEKGNRSASKELYESAIDMYAALINEKIGNYEADIAATYCNLATLQSQDGAVTAAKQNFKKALEIYTNLAKNNANAYEPYLENTLGNIQKLLSEKNESNYREKLSLYRSLANQLPASYNQVLAQMLNTLADFLDKTNPNEESERLYQESLTIYKSLAAEQPTTYRPYVARSLGNLSFHSLLMKHYLQAEQYAKEGLATDSSKHFIYANLAPALLFQGKREEAEEIYLRFKTELRKMFLDDFLQFEKVGVIPAEYSADVEDIKSIIQ